ncbi:Pinoresinol reductase 1 [Leucoagaricus sp. SymC.cos]|nr:Pinoresinol reductase 1 [Leucoagaricus sp. SymC.cos]
MKVALAGASSGVGRHIAESILKDGRHPLIILSRHEISHFAQQRVRVAIVSYDDHQSLTAALDGVHTVISAIGDHSKSGAAQLALVHAATAAKVTRFIPSGWSGTDGGQEDVIQLYRFKQPALAALQASGMQWAHPENGIFLNYLATPTKGVGYLKPLKFWIDVENCNAVIPGDGNLKLSYTAVEDVADFVAKLIDVEEPLPNPLRIAGSIVTHNELVMMAEKVQGKPFTVTYKSEQDLKGSIVKNPPSPMVNMATNLSLALLDGRFSFDTSPVNVNMTFVNPEAFLEKWWRA